MFVGLVAMALGFFQACRHKLASFVQLVVTAHLGVAGGTNACMPALYARMFVVGVRRPILYVTIEDGA